MKKEILESEKQKVFAGIDQLCEKILSCEADRAKQEDLIEEFCFIADLAHISTNPALLSHISLERIEKCLKIIKPLLGFRICLPYDDEYFDFAVKKGKKELDIKLCDDNRIFVSFDEGNTDGCFYGFRQFVYQLSDWCGEDIYNWDYLADNGFYD